jgi:hypothetical protein
VEVGKGVAAVEPSQSDEQIMDSRLIFPGPRDMATVRQSCPDSRSVPRTDSAAFRGVLRWPRGEGDMRQPSRWPGRSEL